MTITFNNKIQPIQNNSMEEFKELAHLPDKCPVCQIGISPEFVLLFSNAEFSKQLLCICPIGNCKSLFIAYYDTTNVSLIMGIPKMIITKYSPQSKIKKEFPEEIRLLSPQFVDIYNQAFHADQGNLNLICGVGYRKALEFLIKDYAKSISEEEEHKVISSMPLQKCLKQYTSEPIIRDVTERAIWLGNDETHYERIWEDKDINDLKNLIDITVYFLSMKIKAEKYKAEMLK